SSVCKRELVGGFEPSPSLMTANSSTGQDGITIMEVTVVIEGQRLSVVVCIYLDRICCVYPKSFLLSVLLSLCLLFLMEDVFLFELGYGIQLAAALLLLYRISTMKNIYGLSIDTQVCFLMGTLSRFIWMMDTRLVETWFSYLELWFNLAVQLALCYYCY
ncbi:hypothetical protein FOZ62_010258, partial [Perkinsus olseni]